MTKLALQVSGGKDRKFYKWCKGNFYLDGKKGKWITTRAQMHKAIPDGLST